MDQQAPVPPPGDGEAVSVAPVTPRVEVPFAAPVPPPPPVLIADEPVMQVEKFLRLQPPTYSGGPNPDTAEYWVHEIERVFAIMRCLAVDRVVLAAYQLRGFALEWWRLKMQTTFAGYQCYNCNQPGHLFRNCPYPREYGYGRGVQQPQQFQQPQSGRGRGAPQQRGRGRVRARRTSLVRRPVPGRAVVVQGQHLQQSSFSSLLT
ncbi:hypothetical protein Taro_043550 [Colocasia esculenta]|uniref:CCHC-type domain-containing protein n=1 Tax=Colocasia esculenta TaxID=4460 RepID=A0A843X1Q9_COLES|nr:hypothetical protein [Colocasia esculenta]